MAQVRETLHDEINLQQVASKMKFVWPPNERRYVIERTS